MPPTPKQNPFDALSLRHVAILGGFCDHPEDDRRACPKCRITTAIQHVVDGLGVSPEDLFFIYARLAAEHIGSSAGGAPKHRLLLDTFHHWLALTTKVVEAEKGRGQIPRADNG